MLKGAIIGCGKIAQTGHIPAFLDVLVKDKVEIVAGMDTNENRLKEFKTHFPNAEVFTNAEKMFNSCQLDFVDISVPPNFHTFYIEEAISRQLHILCEKPLTEDIKSARQIKKKLTREYKGIFFPFHQYKYSPIWKHFQKFIIESNPYEKFFIQFNVLRKEADIGYDALAPFWRIDRTKSGGGIIADTGYHYLYLSQWLLGKPDKISALTAELRLEPYAVEDTAAIILTFDKGIVQINLTWAASSRSNSAFITTGSSLMKYDGESLLKITEDEIEKIEVPDASDKKTYISFYVNLISDFINIVEAKQNFTAGIEEAYNTQRLLRKCYLSARLGKSVNCQL
ncbi:MAG: Gfo/Idh/MocA family protein [Ignavibacteria bacterium]